MTPRIRFKHWLPRGLNRFWGVFGFRIGAITLYPYILFADEQGSVPLEMLGHEYIHFVQVKNVGYVRFYLSYLVWYIGGLIFHGSHYWAYRSIPTESAAYSNQSTAAKVIARMLKEYEGK